MRLLSKAQTLRRLLLGVFCLVALSNLQPAVSSKMTDVLGLKKKGLPRLLMKQPASKEIKLAEPIYSHCQRELTDAMVVSMRLCHQEATLLPQGGGGCSAGSSEPHWYMVLLSQFYGFDCGNDVSKAPDDEDMSQFATVIYENFQQKLTDAIRVTLDMKKIPEFGVSSNDATGPGEYMYLELMQDFVTRRVKGCNSNGQDDNVDQFFNLAIFALIDGLKAPTSNAAALAPLNHPISNVNAPADPHAMMQQQPVGSTVTSTSFDQLPPSANAGATLYDPQTSAATYDPGLYQTATLPDLASGDVRLVNQFLSNMPNEQQYQSNYQAAVQASLIPPAAMGPPGVDSAGTSASFNQWPPAVATLYNPQTSAAASSSSGYQDSPYVAGLAGPANSNDLYYDQTSNAVGFNQSSDMLQQSGMYSSTAQPNAANQTTQLRANNDAHSAVVTDPYQNPPPAFGDTSGYMCGSSTYDANLVTLPSLPSEDMRFINKLLAEVPTDSTAVEASVISPAAMGKPSVDSAGTPSPVDQFLPAGTAVETLYNPQTTAAAIGNSAYQDPSYVAGLAPQHNQNDYDKKNQSSGILRQSLKRSYGGQPSAVVNRHTHLPPSNNEAYSGGGATFSNPQPSSAPGSSAGQQQLYSDMLRQTVKSSSAVQPSAVVNSPTHLPPKKKAYSGGGGATYSGGSNAQPTTAGGSNYQYTDNNYSGGGSAAGVFQASPNTGSAILPTLPYIAPAKGRSKVMNDLVPLTARNLPPPETADALGAIPDDRYNIILYDYKITYNGGLKKHIFSRWFAGENDDCSVAYFSVFDPSKTPFDKELNYYAKTISQTDAASLLQFHPQSSTTDLYVAPQDTHQRIEAIIEMRTTNPSAELARVAIRYGTFSGNEGSVRTFYVDSKYLGGSQGVLTWEQFLGKFEGVEGSADKMVVSLYLDDISTMLAVESESSDMKKGYNGMAFHVARVTVVGSYKHMETDGIKCKDKMCWGPAAIRLVHVKRAGYDTIRTGSDQCFLRRLNTDSRAARPENNMLKLNLKDSKIDFGDNEIINVTPPFSWNETTQLMDDHENKRSLMMSSGDIIRATLVAEGKMNLALWVREDGYDTVSVWHTEFHHNDKQTIHNYVTCLVVFAAKPYVLELPGQIDFRSEELPWALHHRWDEELLVLPTMTISEYGIDYEILIF
eukprot:GHVS01047873.1.p1 GENE.GHVS01047873.1~~GHVS01047873.1.p1  ORF type:complete len:1173 (+),score=142.07 GHVS01047873.1:29-3547(+)